MKFYVVKVLLASCGTEQDIFETHDKMQALKIEREATALGYTSWICEEEVKNEQD